MTLSQSDRSRPLGETSGSSQRPPQQLTGTTLTLNLEGEVAQLKHEAAWLSGDRNAKTLVKTGPSRVVLTALKAGARLNKHSAAGPATIQALSGHLRLQVNDETIDLPRGALVSFDRDVPHDVEAMEDSAFLLTISRIAPAESDQP